MTTPSEYPPVPPPQPYPPFPADMGMAMYGPPRPPARNNALILVSIIAAVELVMVLILGIVASGLSTELEALKRHTEQVSHPSPTTTTDVPSLPPTPPRESAPHHHAEPPVDLDDPDVDVYPNKGVTEEQMAADIRACRYLFNREAGEHGSQGPYLRCVYALGHTHIGPRK